MNKREAREILFTLVFESEFHSGRDADEIYETAREERGFENYRYIKKGLRDIMGNREKIATVIESRADGWKVSRMTPSTRAILFVGVFDMILKSTTPSIAINEAVELAKKFAEDNAAAFINGILNTIADDAETIKAGFAEDASVEAADVSADGADGDSDENE